jgi:hypothetical protein
MLLVPDGVAAGRDTLLSRVSARDMQHIYDTMSGMKEFARLTVMRYDANKEKLREDLLGLGAKARVKECPHGRGDCAVFADE